MGPARDWKTSKVQKFRHCLLRWFLKHRRDLPWRENPTPYKVWISEIMLQQTQVRTVIPYYNRFLDRFPDLDSLAQASEREVLELWSGLGYYTRARNLHRAAQIILQRHGSFPQDLNVILALPGIGRYTAGAICSIAFNQPQPIVDGNIQRVIVRLRGIRRRIPDSFFWSQMAAWVSPKQPSNFNQAMMELGALICIPLHPRCEQCPVAKFCDACAFAIQDRIPRVRAKPKTRNIRIAVLVLEKKGRILLTSCHRSSIIPGQWGLPCRNIPDGESPENAAAALAKAILGRVIPLTHCTRPTHSISKHRIAAYAFVQQGNSPLGRLASTSGFRWVSRDQCRQLLLSSLFHKILLQTAE